jgi:hypothetical protein
MSYPPLRDHTIFAHLGRHDVGCLSLPSCLPLRAGVYRTDVSLIQAMQEDSRGKLTHHHHGNASLRHFRGFWWG